MQIEVGQILEGKVTGITNYGAFVALPGGRSGMVHISEVANTYVSDIHEHLSDGQTVTVKVIAITPEGKINLSIKKALPPQPPEARRDGPRPGRFDGPRPPRTDGPRPGRFDGPRPERGEGAYPARGGQRPERGAYTPAQGGQERGGYAGGAQTVHEKTGDAAFEDKLKRFMQESDNKMAGSRVYEQPKRSTRRRK